MKFKTIEELVATWRQAEAADDGKRYHLLCVDDIGMNGLSRLKQWSEDRRRWVSLPLNEALCELFMDLGYSGKIQRMADVDASLASYELEEVSQ